MPNVFNTGRSGMVAAKAAIATTGHNIANANSEGYSRQRVQTEAATSLNGISNKGVIGSGTQIARVERINDEYVEKQVRGANRDLAHMEEKDMVLKQTEDIFNEMNGDGVNRLVSRFFNEFRKLGNEPENEAVRESVREASQALVNDFHRIRSEVDQVRAHIDSRLEGYSREANDLAEQLKDLNIQIQKQEAAGAPANDLQDKRDLAMKKLATYADMSVHKDKQGSYIVDIKGVGPLVVGPQAEKFSVDHSPADDMGKVDGALDLKTSASARSVITHQVKGGKFGALLEVRDQTLSTISDRLDEMAFTLSQAVNNVHGQGFNRYGLQGVAFFKPMDSADRAAEFLDLSDEVKASANNIATAARPDSPGDNRIAIAISGLQNEKILGEGNATMDDFYNSMVSDVGVSAARNRNGMNQQRDIISQLTKMRDQISGVSIDEETANLMQFQHAFDASAKVIQVADDMLKTVLELKR